MAAAVTETMGRLIDNAAWVVPAPGAAETPFWVHDPRTFRVARRATAAECRAALAADYPGRVAAPMFFPFYRGQGPDEVRRWLDANAAG